MLSSSEGFQTVTFSGLTFLLTTFFQTQPLCLNVAFYGEFN